MMIEDAFDAAKYLYDLIKERRDMRLVWKREPDCCQVCFYFAGEQTDWNEKPSQEMKKRNSKITRQIVHGLVLKGWMVDYAPGNFGEFLRVVVNRGTTKGISEELVKTIAKVGAEVLMKL